MAPRFHCSELVQRPCRRSTGASPRDPRLRSGAVLIGARHLPRPMQRFICRAAAWTPIAVRVPGDIAGDVTVDAGVAGAVCCTSAARKRAWFGHPGRIGRAHV